MGGTRWLALYYYSWSKYVENFNGSFFTVFDLSVVAFDEAAIIPSDSKTKFSSFHASYEAIGC